MTRPAKRPEPLRLGDDKIAREEIEAFYTRQIEQARKELAEAQERFEHEKARNEAAIDAYRDLKGQVEAELGVDWDTHCSDSCPIPYLYVRGTEVTAYRGYPKPVTSLDVDPEWKPKLDGFLESQGIEPPEGENQPGWWTASWWG